MGVITTETGPSTQLAERYEQILQRLRAVEARLQDLAHAGRLAAAELEREAARATAGLDEGEADAVYLRFVNEAGAGAVAEACDRVAALLPELWGATPAT